MYIDIANPKRGYELRSNFFFLEYCTQISILLSIWVTLNVNHFRVLINIS
jgi:hypothetical protein